MSKQFEKRKGKELLDKHDEIISTSLSPAIILNIAGECPIFRSRI